MKRGKAGNQEFSISCMTTLFNDKKHQNDSIKLTRNHFWCLKMRKYACFAKILLNSGRFQTISTLFVASLLSC